MSVLSQIDNKMSLLDIKEQLSEAVRKAYLDSLQWGKKNLTTVQSEDTLLGAIHQYRMWKTSFLATYTLLSAPPEEPITPITGTYPGKKEKSLTELLNNSFTTDDKTEIKTELDMGYWASKANMAKTALQVSVDGYISDLTQTDEHLSTILSIRECFTRIAAIDDSDIDYGNSGALVSLGMLLLNSPSTINSEDVEALITDIRERTVTLKEIQSSLSMVPQYNDEEVKSTIAQFSEIGLNDYVDNILTGNIFGIGEESSHVAALVNMTSMSLGVLEPCVSKIRSSHFSPGALTGTVSQSMDTVTKVVGELVNAVNSTIKASSRAAMGAALALIGVSESLIDVMVGIKMQIQSMQKKAEDAARSISLSATIVPPDGGECPISAMISLNTLKATAEAAIKAGVMAPAMSMANTILKPILEEVSNIENEIKSYQDMLGESVSAVYKSVPTQKWVDYAIVYQIKMMERMVVAQLEHYSKIERALIALKRSTKSNKSGVGVVNRVFQSSIRSLNKIAAEHDAQINNTITASQKEGEAIKVLGSIITLLTRRTPSAKDKITLMEALKRFDKLKERTNDSVNNIRESSKNIEGIWKQITNMQAEDVIGKSLAMYLDSYYVYSSIVKTVFGINLMNKIDLMKEVLEGDVGPLPVIDTTISAPMER